MIKMLYLTGKGGTLRRACLRFSQKADWAGQVIRTIIQINGGCLWMAHKIKRNQLQSSSVRAHLSILLPYKAYSPTVSFLVLDPWSGVIRHIAGAT